MSDFKQDMARIQELVVSSYTKTGSLVALADGGFLDPVKLQKTLEQTAGDFEKATLEVRTLCEQYSPGVGNIGHKPALKSASVAGFVECLNYNRLHIQLNTLLPHCRFQSPLWLTDTIRRLLDEYEKSGNTLPFFRQALLVIDEHSGIMDRRVFDQDNKGWKAVSNAIKGRLIPDDDQHTLSVALLSARSPNPVCHITLLELEDAADFFSARAYGAAYSGEF